MKQLAIISNFRLGYVDHCGIIFHFSVDMLDGGAGLNVNYETVAKFMLDNYIENIGWFNGKSCVVDSDGPGSIVKFIEFRK